MRPAAPDPNRDPDDPDRVGVATAPVLLTAEAARELTDDVKHDAAALWAKLLRLYQGQAHKALGYGSWGDYYKAEFGRSGRHGYRLLEAAEVYEALASDPGVTELPATEKHARALASLTDKPEELRDTWLRVVEAHGTKPTAAEVRAIVEGRNATLTETLSDVMALASDFGWDLLDEQQRNALVKRIREEVGDDAA